MPLVADMAPTIAAIIEPSMPEAGVFPAVAELATGAGLLEAAILGDRTKRALNIETIATNDRRHTNTVLIPMTTIVHI